MYIDIPATEVQKVILATSVLRRNLIRSHIQRLRFPQIVCTPAPNQTNTYNVLKTQIETIIPNPSKVKSLFNKRNRVYHVALIIQKFQQQHKHFSIAKAESGVNALNIHDKFLRATFPPKLLQNQRTQIPSSLCTANYITVWAAAPFCRR